MIKIGILSFTQNSYSVFADIIEGHADCKIIGICRFGKLVMVDDAYIQLCGLDDLIATADLIVFDNADSSHFPLIRNIVRQSKHLYIQQVKKFTPDDTLRFVELTGEAGVQFVISQLHRANPFIQKTLSGVQNQTFINITENGFHGYGEPFEYSRLIEKVDLALMCAKSNIYRISACSSSDEFMNIRLEFNNAINANITINQLAENEQSWIEVLSPGENIKIDLLTHEIFKLKKSRTNRILKETVVHSEISEQQLLAEEFSLLVKCLIDGTEASYNIEGYHFANIIAEEVLSKISYVLT
jgi:hypothetical protein